MEVKDYCKEMQRELVGWKAKVYDAIRKLDKMPSEKKEEVSSHIDELHSIIDDITRRIEILNIECPSDWEPEKAEISSKISKLEAKWSQVWDQYGVVEY